jgi:hypothetical protein
MLPRRQADRLTRAASLLDRLVGSPEMLADDVFGAHTAARRTIPRPVIFKPSSPSCSATRRSCRGARNRPDHGLATCRVRFATSLTIA